MQAPEISTPRLMQKVGAEMVGTFALVFAGCGAIMVDAGTAQLGAVGVSAVFGLIIMVMIYATGHICGAHFNPAVTVAFAMCGRFPWKQVPAYVLGQVAAALLAAAALRFAIGDVAHLGATSLGSGVEISQAVIVELIITFFLMFVIISVATDSRAVGSSAGLAIGGTVALCALFAGPLTGASMNPARSLGPALVGGSFADLWLYMVVPVVGAILGGLVYRALRCSETGEGTADGCC